MLQRMLIHARPTMEGHEYQAERIKRSQHDTG